MDVKHNTPNSAADRAQFPVAFGGMETPDMGKAANWTHPAVVLATGLWLGRIPVAPGTFGTLLGLPLAWGTSFVPSPWLQAVVIAILFAISVPICTIAAVQLGGKKDPGAIVLDEIVSLPVTFFLVSRNQFEQPLVMLIGFALHRLFDITKPPPARQLERLPTGLGIMADDIAAGIYSCLALHLILLTNWFGKT
jgi:phosphatidylglycerophosphatase A